MEASYIALRRVSRRYTLCLAALFAAQIRAALPVPIARDTAQVILYEMLHLYLILVCNFKYKS